MRRLRLWNFLTLDGKIAGPHGELDWMPGNARPDREVDLAAAALLDEVDTVLLGRGTYEEFVSFWPTATTADDPIADQLNAKEKVVFSRTLRSVHWGKWNNARLATRPLAEEVAALKRAPGKDMVVFGGAGFAQSLLEQALLDEVDLIVAPTILGTGKPFFGEGTTPATWKLLGSEAFPSGSVLMRYEPK